MQLNQELHIIQNALEELKGIDIVTLDVSSYTSLLSYMIICTGSSSRHVKSLADNAERLAKENQLTLVGYEGNANSDWVLVDLGSIVVHVMLAEAREFYNLEKLWGTFDNDEEVTCSLSPNEH